MKKLEYKNFLKETFENNRLEAEKPKVWSLLKCKEIKYATGGCTCCWYCEACGKTGCNNMLGWKPGDSVQEIECDLED